MKEELSARLIEREEFERLWKLRPMRRRKRRVGILGASSRRRIRALMKRLIRRFKPL